MQLAPFGSWKSPITADAIVADSIGLGSIVIDGADIYWLESRPQEAGRSVIVRRTSDGKNTDVTPPEYNVRNRVHEYGGAAYTVVDGCVYFSNISDNCLYVQDLRSEQPQQVRQLTHDKKKRYADLSVDTLRHRLICVQEEHDSADFEPLNTIVSIDIAKPDDIQVMAGGCDFYAAPRLSPDGSRLAWLSWNHPNLPWDGTNLQVANIVNGYLAAPSLIAGGANQAIFQPQWAGDDTLYFVSDRTGWGNLYCWQGSTVKPVHELEAEFGLPQWVFGMSTYALVGNRIVCTYTQRGVWHLALINTLSGHLTRLNVPYTDISNVRAAGNLVVCCAASATHANEIITIDLLTESREILQRSNRLKIDPRYFSIPESIEFPTTDGNTAFAFYYPPTNPDYQPLLGEKPPLLVKSHGGPTAATSNQLSLKTQYWTSRGFAVVDVNYGGSTGYGKAYQHRLDGKWGIVDVDDCTNAALYLVRQGLADANRLAISGGSAGGYTTLAALTFGDTFKAGASYYGVSDLASLAKDTHKFESRYLDRLVAPYPAQADLYQARSPLYFTDRLSCPIAFFQGLEDKVVPPNQAEMMVAVLKAKQIPVAYVTFPTEQHGFRQAENIKRALTGEFYFYAQIFGFELAEEIEPIQIDR
ncbi:S9 family peptidase [Chamaesiphon minutus]|uniref:Dipeptidyl aminopeptidase/acylaminoacyl peptidase n=1 Tax=Chamaesiphon minutus (strain ATCC 27169 / PCC 6605) TaxID=1173020 RepID=K9UCW7_CHAP6|nr:prolyl oligopeptidase family serine peptidase [Chamaesiphon minutus]AFY92256.1 dipeptidyl aminopeptidase/acylaminoacyl peptidase [Chamaesiphon minutus PCC 6605]